jgi:hypothetical protein
VTGSRWRAAQQRIHPKAGDFGLGDGLTMGLVQEREKGNCWAVHGRKEKGPAPRPLWGRKGDSTRGTMGQIVCCGLCQESFFSGVVALLNSVDAYVKGCYMRTT